MKDISLKLNWIGVALLLSLGVNFFVLGFVYSQHKAKEISMTRLAFDYSISKLIEPLPRNAKHKFYMTMRSNREQLIPIYNNIMEQRAAIMTIIATDPLDKDKLSTALKDYHNSYHSLVGNAQEVMVKVIDTLNAQERQEIFQRFKNPPKKSFRRGGSNSDAQSPAMPNRY